ncbi:cpw-wpc domain-containing protein, putative [Babesia ovata]|uniref:Cpw-wpc domain-containing protein, putative n=1 Tax=Babesia ovata TaxID=189622 RepID=A0A2H6KIA7_9APIC|nr:cpw-wpc domain-containing protein, putative [Babesia ovata]GBE62727.1 cpw-wpc domain-containing protein, putative [Babesia ovata]
MPVALAAFGGSRPRRPAQVGDSRKPRHSGVSDDTHHLNVVRLYKAFKSEPKEEHVEERVGDLVASAASQESPKEIDPFTSQCVRDFAQPCPEGWTKVDDMCEAPASYKGDCARSVDTSEFTVERKMLFMEDCKVEWPCKSAVDKTDAQYCQDTERNFLQPCPENFLRHKQDSGYVCVPDFSGYMGPCNSIVDFTDFTRESKMIWAQTCGTTWPCMTVCPKVFDRCPLDWTMAPDGACDAPASYKGPCEKRAYFTYYTQEMKRKKLLECDIPFECSSDCKRDYNRCPVLWKEESGGYCVLPSGAFSCRDILIDILKQAGRPHATLGSNAFDLRSLDIESKKLFESKCSNVVFPCMEDDDGINWSLQCPRGWTISAEDLRSCRLPKVNDEDLCQSQVIFNDEEEKRAFASRCQINWSGTQGSTTPATSATKAAKEEDHVSGPITDIGSVHEVNKTPDQAPSTPQATERQQTRSARKKLPREKIVSAVRGVLDVGPYVVGQMRSHNRRLFKGFTREVHLLPGST